MKQKKQNNLKQKRKWDFLRIIGVIFLISFFFFFMMFFKYVSIGDKIAPETYTINGEVDFDSWFWNIGIFIAMMMGLERFCSFACDLTFPKVEEE